MHHKATKQAKSTPTTHQKKQQSTSNPHQNQTKSHKMGWVCSQKLTLSPHPDKPSHYLLWPLLVFELTPPLLSKKSNRTERLVSQLAYCNNSMMAITNHMVVKAKTKP